MILSNRVSLTVLLTLLAFGASAARAAGQGERSSEYQGRLVGSDANASSVDVRITFYDPADGGKALSTVDKPGVKVVDGLFKVPLEMPAAPAKASGPSKGMEFEVAVRVPAGGSGPFTSLSGRAGLPPKVYDVASDALRVDALGNVGLGTDSPTARLDVNGSMRAASIEVAGGVITGGVSSVLGLEVRAPGGTPGIDFSSDATVDYNARLWYNQGANRLQLDNVDFYAPIYRTGHGGGLYSDGRLHLSSGPDETLYINPWHGGTVIGGAGGRGLWIETPIIASQKAEFGGELIVRGGVHFDKWLVTNGGVNIQGAVEVGLNGATVSSDSSSLTLKAPKDGRIVLEAREIDVIGSINKLGGFFKIDHPLDPERKFLSHSFVESPDMKNIYDGVAITDEDGYATISLPSYFEALNRDFRYQLTVIDEDDSSDELLWARVVRKVDDNQFKIRTARGGVEVSWQVTGIRKDAYAERHPIVVEADKGPGELGRYLSPESFDQPVEMGIHFGGAHGETAPASIPPRADDESDCQPALLEEK